MKRSTGSSIPALALSAVALLVVTAALVFYLVNRPPGDGSAEAGFARDMSVHHAQAVEMAEIALSRTDNPRIRTLATDITLTQQAQIGQMQGWLDIWQLPAASPEPAMAWMGMPMDGRMPGMASPEDINRLRDAPPEEMNEQFLRLMIPHHAAAIPMAQAVLDRSDNPVASTFARKVISAQRAEIQVMQDMLRDMGAPPVDQEDMPMDGMSMDGAG